MDDEKKIDPTLPPQNGQSVVPHGYIKPQARREHDPAITFEEYHWYALRTREEEKSLEPAVLNWREIILRKKKTTDTAEDHEFGAEKFANHANRMEITDEEWTNASRAFRTASWGACTSRDQRLDILRVKES
jgi:hypothetical protein